ncbi:class I adenylate-forming enzyme family protein [Desmospora activa]|uniref:Acyl-CoA synthetase (AMP-forming)/AMP-acid ligase II n=1 Tax=Desmospora activa DSM 45169 TaxID=1121389 RepID=A0A2T4Z730_9BACL|nr:AMP-binding protein [Desmospora activa]PTM57707.1 acyl-CoA synthetase (AMP-forming)/AMP-acid ligase II [Desmospora activa DSM 45169]
MATIGECIRHRARLSPQIEAVVSGDNRITFADFNQMVNQLAHYFISHQVEKGDRIALVCNNSIPFPLLFMAAAKVGAVIIPINWRLKTAEIQWILEDCKPCMLFYHEEFEQVEPLLNLPFLKQAICVGTGERIYDSFRERFASLPPTEPTVLVLEEDPALIIYTSGTTGKPKGVICTHRNVYNACLSNNNTLDLRMGDRFLFVTPLFHISGMIFTVGVCVRGITLVLGTQFHPVEIWNQIEKERVTAMMSVPSMLPYMLQTLQARESDPLSLRWILCGGSLVPTQLIHAFNEMGYPIAQVYGATEYSGAITYWIPEMGIENCGSVGKAVYLTELKIVDPTTNEAVPPGEMGEVVCRGDLIFSGYWNNPEATEEVIQNGWLHTRDVGWMDEEGFLYIVDRLRDMIITSGENVFPAEVEAVIQQLDQVAESAVVGVKHDVWGELARAYIVQTEGGTLTEEQVLAHVHQHLAEHKLREVVFVGELPRNGMGKVMKYVLRDHAVQEI